MINDEELILLCAVRYACGRQSYMPDIVIGYMTPKIKNLSINVLHIMDRDLTDCRSYSGGISLNIFERSTVFFYVSVDKPIFRSKTIAFRASPEEVKLIEFAISLTGMMKQGYYIAKPLNREIHVTDNSRIHRAVYDRLTEVLAELRRIDAGQYIFERISVKRKFYRSILKSQIKHAIITQPTKREVFQ